MEKKELLTEKNYERTKKKIKNIALIILVIGFLIGGGFIAIGLTKQSKVNSQYSEDNKANISQQLETEKQSLIEKKSELKAKIEPVETQIKQLERETFTGFNDAYYERKDKIKELEESIATDQNTISVIERALDESFSWCNFEAKNNTYTSKYCSLKLQLEDLTDFNKGFAAAYSIPFYMIGAFIIIATCMIAGSVYIFSKRREMMTFSAQQVMPLAQEGIEKMGPSVAKVGREIMKDNAPVYGDVAKEIAQGIKEGINNANNNK